MARRHLFLVVVLLAAAAVAGLLALTRGVQQDAKASPALDAQIAARTHAVDRLEASLRRALAEQRPLSPAPRASARTVFVQSSASRHDDEHAGDHEDEHADDHGDHDHEHEGGDD